MINENHSTERLLAKTVLKNPLKLQAAVDILRDLSPELLEENEKSQAKLRQLNEWMKKETNDATDDKMIGMFSQNLIESLNGLKMIIREVGIGKVDAFLNQKRQEFIRSAREKSSIENFV